MATWESLLQYIRSHYQVAGEGPGAVRLMFDLGNGRSQNVVVSGKQVGDFEYLAIWTPVCHESQISAREALLRNTNMALGALALVEDGTMILRHTAPLKDLDVDEFEVPLRALTQAGDMLEQQFGTADQY
jgi:hypothetical protein